MKNSPSPAAAWAIPVSTSPVRATTADTAASAASSVRNAVRRVTPHWARTRRSSRTQAMPITSMNTTLLKPNPVKLICMPLEPLNRMVKNAMTRAMAPRNTPAPFIMLRRS